MLIEIQALVDGSHGQSPKRLSVGLDHNRLAMLLASLNRHAGVACYDQDVFVNAVGGVKITEPGVDLAILCAIVSSFKDQSLDQKTVIFGEIGLAGEVRPVQRGQERLKEAAKLGFTRAIIPKANQAKQLDITMILVGHVTKEGTLAGPRVLEHIVDTVLYFEGDPSSSFRMIRAFKNRYGAVNELGVFAMTEKGLKEVTNPSALFLSHHHKQVNGSCITCIQEGSRPMLIEIQALVDGSHGQSPKRLSVGLDHNRLAMLLASLNRHAGVACYDQDVFVNAVGGVKITEPGVDLAILCAIVSSFKDQPLDQKTVIFGEIGLAGEVRPVQRGQERLKEAAKLGFTRAIIPKANQAKQKIKGIEIFPVESLSQALDLIKQ
jgi:predicted ATP-dependent serine protease